MDFDNYRQNGYSRDEMLHRIESALEKLNDKELEAIYYDLLTREYIRD
jgi:hypothetical protein